MNVTFTPQPIPELAIGDGMLAGLVFSPAHRCSSRCGPMACGSPPSPMKLHGKPSVRLVNIG